MIGEIMRKPERETRSDSDVLAEDLTAWVRMSHYWDEYCTGYYKCEWCGITHTSESRSDSDLCPKNPAVLRLLEQRND